jgi:hypothetical protein
MKIFLRRYATICRRMRKTFIGRRSTTLFHRIEEIRVRKKSLIELRGLL